MSEKKPIPIFVKQNGKRCPICGKKSYSREGIHPQCAMVEADAPRIIRLLEKRKIKAIEKKQKTKPR